MHLKTAFTRAARATVATVASITPVAAIAIAEAARTTVTVAEAAAIGALFALLHHGRGAFLVGFDLDGHEAQDVFGKTHLALHLVERCRRTFEVHQRVVCLPVLLDPVGEGLQSPVLDPTDRTAISGDDALVAFHKRIDLLLRQILPGEKHMFV